jgi:hypothetical protein
LAETDSSNRPKGVYTYGASVCSDADRSHRIARLDGIETMATVAGTLLSPIVTEHLGYFGNYGLYGGLTFLAIVYLQLCVKEPVGIFAFYMYFGKFCLGAKFCAQKRILHPDITHIPYLQLFVKEPVQMSRLGNCTYIPTNIPGLARMQFSVQQISACMCLYNLF